MKKYHLTILLYYNNSDGTHQTSIVCDGISYSEAGCYEFWVKKGDGREVIAYYPIRHTIITSIEQDEEYKEPICPKCGSYDYSYWVSKDKMYCSDCGFNN